MTNTSSDSVAALAKNSPPAPGAMKYFSLTKCHAAINDFEKQLGLPRGKMIYNINKANARYFELEAILAEKNGRPAMPGPVSVAPAQAANVQAAIQATALSRPQCLAVAKVLGIDLGTSPEKVGDAEVWQRIEKTAFQSCLRVRGMRTDTECAGDYWRKHEPSAITGVERYIRAQAQQAIKEICK
jgi:hypothetical protein